MTYTVTFSHVVEGKRVPLYVDGREVMIVVDAPSRSSAIYHDDVKKICEDHNATVRMVR